MKRTRLRAKRPGKRRTVHPVQPAWVTGREPWNIKFPASKSNPHRLTDGSVKRAEYRMGVDLRRLAAGRPCMVRLPGCDGGGETTVLAHLRMQPYTGIGIKPNDFVWGAWACAVCHDILDGRRGPPFYETREDIEYDHMMAILRTQMALI